jgi:hypothetical protein
MGLYVPYGNEKPWVKFKFKKFVLASVIYDNAEYLCKVSSGARDKSNNLEECAHQIFTEIKKSMLKEGEEQLAVAECTSKLCSTNKTAEYVMGLWDNPVAHWVQESAPYFYDLTDGCPIMALGPHPSFQSRFHVVSFFIELILNHL